MITAEPRTPNETHLWKGTLVVPDREPLAQRGRLEPADLLYPPHVQLDLRPGRGQRIGLAVGASGEVARRSDSAWVRDRPLYRAR